MKNVTVTICFNDFGIGIFIFNFLVHGIVSTVINRCILQRKQTAKLCLSHAEA